MWIVLFALRYKYTIAVFAILILLFGVLSGKRMSTDILPKVDAPELMFVWTYSGLNATEMAAKITTFSETGSLNNLDDLAAIANENLKSREAAMDACRQTLTEKAKHVWGSLAAR
jgi:multidrug efflux pump subunit AcrB